MTSCVFAFGPGSTWFYESPSVWKWGDLPAAIHNRIPKVGEKAGGSKISHVHNLIFGANSSYMITWKGKDGSNYQANHGLPANLTAWLDKKNTKGFLIRDLVNLRLALGPNNASFFVTDGKDYLWQNLPASLDNAIEKLRKKGGGFTSAPRLVCLGVNSSYIMITAGNGGAWNLSDDYPELGSYVAKLKAENGNKGGMFAGVSYVSLDSFDGQNYVLIRGGGHTAWIPDQTMEAFKTVAATIRSGTARAPAHRHSSGMGGILKLANMVLNAENNSSGGGYGGGGDSGGGINYTQANMDFTQNLQNQTWNSVDSAASNWNVQ